jgi:hypothetical protein
MDSFVQCHYCKTTLTNPLELVCKHSFCSECLTRQIQNDKIFCPICNTEHVTPAGSLSSAKPDTLVPYLIGLSRFVYFIRIFGKSLFLLEIVVPHMLRLLTIHHQHFRPNVLDAKRILIYVYVIIVINRYVSLVEQNIMNHKKKMLIIHFII